MSCSPRPRSWHPGDASTSRTPVKAQDGSILVVADYVPSPKTASFPKRLSGDFLGPICEDPPPGLLSSLVTLPRG